MEGVILQEEVVEDVVAILLIDVATLKFTFAILDSKAKSLLAMLIVNDLPLGYN
jgi:hypothetical protein